jgi:hypothetical protein
VAEGHIQVEETALLDTTAECTGAGTAESARVDTAAAEGYTAAHKGTGEAKSEQAGMAAERLDHQGGRYLLAHMKPHSLSQGQNCLSRGGKQTKMRRRYFP